jgi:hypothetical protein
VKTAHDLFSGNEFKNEKEFCDFIELNLDLFCKEILGIDLFSYEREFSMGGYERSRRHGTRRIDFLINSKCGQTIGIECKTPKQACELSNAIGQCLSYVSLSNKIKNPIDRIVLLSSKPDGLIPMVIKQFNLPIEFVIVNKTKAIALDINLIQDN